MRQPKRNIKLKPSRNFGSYLRRLRENNTELSQVEAAEQLGLTRQELNYYETGTRAASESMLTRLAHLYHVATAEVLEMAYWPQLILIPLIAIIDPDQISRDLIEEIENGLKEEERKEITHHIEKMLLQRSVVRKQ